MISFFLAQRHFLSNNKQLAVFQREDPERQGGGGMADAAR